MKTPCSLTVILLFPLLVNAYTWQFTSQPIQCSNVSLSIHGSGGQPPYSLLILPTGASPLPQNVEIRPVLNILFSGTSTTLSFKLNYPENSSFVAVVSDQSGFGTGGASTSITVLHSPDSSCYNTSQPWHPTWYFNIDPTDGLLQCESVRNWWEAPDVNGTVTFYGTIPGGTSFTIPQGSLSTNVNTGTGFNWSVNMAAGTTVMLVANDARGIGSGGQREFAIGFSGDDTCINGNSPSSTPGNPAGSYPTGTSNSSGDGHSHSHSSLTGGIVGGVLGAAILLLVAFWLIRRRRRDSTFFQRPEHPVPEPHRPSVSGQSDPTTSGMSEAASESTRDRLLPSFTTKGDSQSSQAPTAPTTRPNMR